MRKKCAAWNFLVGKEIKEGDCVSLDNQLWIHFIIYENIFKRFLKTYSFMTFLTLKYLQYWLNCQKEMANKLFLNHYFLWNIENIFTYEHINYEIIFLGYWANNVALNFHLYEIPISYKAMKMKKLASGKWSLMPHLQDLCEVLLIVKFLDFPFRSSWSCVASDTLLSMKLCLLHFSHYNFI